VVRELSEPPRRGVQVSEEKFLAEALAVVAAAQKENIPLRILGGFAIYVHGDHTPEARSLQQTLGRLGEGQPTFTDLDLGAHSKHSNQIDKMLERQLKFKPNREVNALFGGRRAVYYHPVDNWQVDVFFDKLEFSHTISFGKFPKESRLVLDYPTLNLSDLLLTKTQIHQINRKDLVDILSLLRGHDVGTGADGNASVDSSYIAKILSDDWGFYYDATNNLRAALDLAQKSFAEGKLDEQSLAIVKSRIEKLLAAIDAEPKSGKWKVREKVGTSKKWYVDVEEL
jgi:hypothetical protein